ncbi:HD domain-containing protein [Streptomyces sp. NBC_00882]|uniref:HD domain-containing protein n=1 Tax=Streptomyces sp. NBC_00882 TaxID=2975856 RepID=UPI00386F90F2|nr:HD domain-containing protein [Streptomyces sp. NBC_00882]
MNNSLPTYEQIVALHKKHAPSDAAFDLVFTHCQIIWELAEQLINTSKLSVDADLVKAGCLLHDVGVYRLYWPDGEIDHKNYIKHGTLGYELLKEEGFSEQICRVASCHTGVGLSEKEIVEEGIPIPPADYFAETPEERLVMYADKFHTKTTPPKFMTAETYAEHVKKFGEAKVDKFKQFQAEFGVPDLQPLAEKYSSEII